MFELIEDQVSCVLLLVLSYT